MQIDRQNFSISSRSLRLKWRYSWSCLESWKRPLAMLCYLHHGRCEHQFWVAKVGVLWGGFCTGKHSISDILLHLAPWNIKHQVWQVFILNLNMICKLKVEDKNVAPMCFAQVNCLNFYLTLFATATCNQCQEPTVRTQHECGEKRMMETLALLALECRKVMVYNKEALEERLDATNMETEGVGFSKEGCWMFFSSTE